MAFLHPEWLWLLPLAGLPLLLHIIHFRKYRKVLFPNVQVLETIREEERIKNKLREWLMLLSRILALLALILLFAQPIPKSLPIQPNGHTTWKIYLDQSFSMEAKGVEGLLSDQAVQALRMLLGQMKETDKVQLLTNRLNPAEQKLLSPFEVKELLTNINKGGASPAMREILMRQTTDQEGESRYIWLTDLQKSAFQFPEQWPDDLPSLYILPFQTNSPGNVSVDSAWFDQPALLSGQNARLRVRIRNDSPEILQEIPVYLKLNGQVKPPVSLSMDPYAVAEVVFSFLVPGPGWHDAEVYLQDGNMPFDDSYALGFKVASEIHLFEVYGPGRSDALARLFGQDSLFMFNRQSERTLEVDKIESANLIVLHGLETLGGGLQQALNKSLSNGTQILVIPGAKAQMDMLNGWEALGWNFSGAMDQPVRMALPDPQNPFFKAVFERIDPEMDLPEISNAFVLTPRGAALHRIHMKFAQGSPMLVSSAFDGKGKVWVLAHPIEGFSRHALFVPTMLNIAFGAAPTSVHTKIFGEDVPFYFAKTEQLEDPVYVFEPMYGQATPWIGMRQTVAGKDQVRMARVEPQAGIFRLKRAEEECLRVGVNYHRNESQPEVWTPDLFNKELEARGLEDKITLIQPEALRNQSGLLSDHADPAWWRWLIGIALFSLALEILWMKLWP